MNRLLSLFLCCIALFVLSCKKQNEKYYVQDSFKEWTLFQDGSYWIYLNENSSKFDSSYINDFPQTHFYPPDATTQYEIISYGIYNIGHFLLQTTSVDNSDLVIQGIYSGGIFVLTHLVTGNLSNQVSPNCWVIARYDSLIVNNQKFYNVIHTKDTSYASIKDYYIAKNVGLIKYSIKNHVMDSTWSLLRWHVIQ